MRCARDEDRQASTKQDVQVALEHAQRGYVLDTGRVVLSGPADELLERPEIRTAYLGL